MLTIVLFGAVPLLIIAGRFAALGEFELFDTDASLVAERLHGPLDAPELEYKFRMTTILQPRVLMLGSSNVLQFRGSLFTKCTAPTCFYNAGGGMPTVRAGADFFDRLTMAGRPPDVLLLALDVWQFNPRYEENTHVDTRLRRDLQDQLRLALGVTRKFAPRVLTDADLREFVLGRIPTTGGLRGARAILRSEGFRDDGSYSYGTVSRAIVLSQSPTDRSADAVSRVARDCCRFQRFAHADSRSLEELDELLTAASRAGTKVIAFTVPLSDEVMDSIDRDPAERAGFRDVERSLREVLARHGVPFSPFWRASQAGCGPFEMLDGLHPGEVCAARVLQRIAGEGGNERIVGPYLDLDALQRKTERPSSELSLDDP